MCVYVCACVCKHVCVRVRVHVSLYCFGFLFTFFSTFLLLAFSSSTPLLNLLVIYKHKNNLWTPPLYFLHKAQTLKPHDHLLARPHILTFQKVIFYASKTTFQNSFMKSCFLFSLSEI